MRAWVADFESLRIRRSLLHGWGSLKGQGEPPGNAWVEIRYGEMCDVIKVPAIFGQLNRNAQGSVVHVDFVLYGSLLGEDGPQGTFTMVLEWPDGQRMRLAMSPPRVAPPSRGIKRFFALPWRHYFSRGIRLIRQGQSVVLVGKVARMILALYSSGWDPVRLLHWAEAEGKPLALVIDHDLGGGANLYRHALLSNLAKDGFMPLILSTHHGILAYQLTTRRGTRNRSAHLEDLHALFEHLSLANFQRVIFNNILSFPAPLALVLELSSWLRQKNPGHFLFLVHDYYSVCPVWLLLDDTGKYCGIPDTAVCAKCLRSNTAPFLEFSGGVDISYWRAAWGTLLHCASEIRCFSEASRKLVLRAYPGLEPSRISVVPHQLEHAKLRPIELRDPGWPVIGIIGHIAYHKGGGLVQELANYILHSGSSARIVVVGTIDVPLPASVATVTGTYRPEHLPDILEKHRVNIGFFSSICPETFSYVAEEMMTMGLPVVALDIGAPGERIARYERGHVLPLSTPEVLLEHIADHYLKHVRQPAARTDE